MLEKLENAMKEHADMLTDEEIQLGNKILLYISCCLSGRAYPIGSLEPKQAVSVSHDIFKCLTSLRGKDGSNGNHFLAFFLFRYGILLFSVDDLSLPETAAQIRRSRVPERLDDVVASARLLR